MKNSAFILIPVISLFFQVKGFAQQKITVEADYIHDVINDIASDDYQGRETGTKGCIMAEEYFAAELAKLGLKPAGDSGTYFYHYTIPDPEVTVKASLVIDDRKFYQGYSEDFSVAYRSATGQAMGEIVYAGYGIYNPDKHRNDFDTLNLKGKIVLMKRGAPRNDMSGWLPSCIDSVKASYCFEHGAAGVLFYEPLVRNNQRVLRLTFGNHLATVSVLKDFPVFTVDERVVRYIFAQAGQSYYRINTLIEAQPAPFRTGSKCAMTAEGEAARPLKARNVLGMIRGTDRELRDEYVIIGGHIDHVGMNESGKIWNGADDNASGPAVALGIARAMVKSNFRPRRSIVFVAWTGEELGLLGSEAWCKKPSLDLSKIVVYFNLDMVGLGNGNLNMPGTAFAPEITAFIKDNLDTALLNRIVWSDGGPGGSDHNNFLYQGVPAFAGMTSGNHPEYHQPGDDPEKINTEILGFTGDFVGTSAALIADSRKELLIAGRQEENKLRLFSFSFFDPVQWPAQKEALKNLSFRMGMINLSSGITTRDENENFISLLSKLDEALEENGNGYKFVVSSSAYDAMMTRSGLMAGYDPSVIGHDPLKMKVLAHQGYRMAVINKNDDFWKDTTLLKKFVRTCDETGTGLILNNLPLPVIDALTSASTDPCVILHTDFLSDRIIQNIKRTGHLVVFELSSSDIETQDIKNLDKLIALIGADHVLVSPRNITPEDLKYLQRFIKQYNDTVADKNLQYKLSGDNFFNYAVRSLQPNM